jgi:hypothetical protein
MALSLFCKKIVKTAARRKKESAILGDCTRQAQQTL